MDLHILNPFNFLVQFWTEERCRLCSIVMQTPCFSSTNPDGKSICFQCMQTMMLSRSQIRLLVIRENLSLPVCSRLPYEPLARKLIHNLKYKHDLLMVEELGILLCDAVERLAEWRESSRTFLVPVPLHWRRKFRRGFNQSELICSVVAKKLRMPMQKNGLKRARPTFSQHNFGRAERRKNVEGAFLADQSIFCGRSIILIDDVLTSGATLIECAKALYDAGAESVSAATLSYASLMSQVPCTCLNGPCTCVMIRD